MLAAPCTYAMKCWSRTLQLPQGVCWMSRLLNIDGSANIPRRAAQRDCQRQANQTNKRRLGSKGRELAASERRQRRLSVMQKCKNSGESERERRTESDALRRAPLAEPCRVAAVVVLVDLEAEHPRLDELVVPLLSLIHI